MSLSAGTRLGPYEIVSAVGAGGMGDVYRARDTRLEREVAVKVLSRDLTSSQIARARFQREARTIAALHHPHICAIYDVGDTPEHEAFIVMDPSTRSHACSWPEPSLRAETPQAPELPTRTSSRYGSRPTRTFRS